MIRAKRILFIFVFLSLNMFKANSVTATSSLDIPDDIVQDWDEAVIEQDKDRQNKYYQRKSNNKALQPRSKKLKRTLKPKTVKQIKAKPKIKKTYKSPLHKPILYQKIYIREKQK